MNRAQALKKVTTRAKAGASLAVLEELLEADRLGMPNGGLTLEQLQERLRSEWSITTQRKPFKDHLLLMQQAGLISQLYAGADDEEEEWFGWVLNENAEWGSDLDDWSPGSTLKDTTPMKRRRKARLRSRWGRRELRRQERSRGRGALAKRPRRASPSSSTAKKATNTKPSKGKKKMATKKKAAKKSTARKGVYRKKNCKGRWMYFRDGKLISKESYDRSKAAKKAAKKPAKKPAKKRAKKKATKRRTTKKKTTKKRRRRTTTTTKARCAPGRRTVKKKTVRTCAPKKKTRKRTTKKSTSASIERQMTLALGLK